MSDPDLPYPRPEPPPAPPPEFPPEFPSESSAKFSPEFSVEFPTATATATSPRRYEPGPAPYRGVGLIPAAGRARTWGLAVVGAPLVLIFLFGLAIGPNAGPDVGSGASAGRSHGTTFGTTFGTTSGTTSGTGGLLPTTAPYTAPATPYTPAITTPPTTPATGGLDSPFGDPSTQVTNTGTGTGASTGTSTGTGSATATPTGAVDPRTVVGAYFEAINARDYSTAWSLGGKNLDPDYDAFVSGYATTKQDLITITDVRRSDERKSVVRLVIRALTTDGRTRSYDAVYTVSGAEIVSGAATPTT